MNVLEGSVNLLERSELAPRVILRDSNLHLPSNSRLLLQEMLDIEPRVAIFLDRDGVIVEDVHYLSSASQLRLLPGVVQALQMLGRRFYLIVVTNQSGVARGFFTEVDLLEIHTELVQRLAAEGAFVDALYYCPHLPEGTVSAYRVVCECRKPNPGLLRRAKDEWQIDMASSFMIGDRVSDIQAGVAANTTGILLSNKKLSLPSGCIFALDLGDAAHKILTEMELE